jgi:RND family efflux transporter MFP subunit
MQFGVTAPGFFSGLIPYKVQNSSSTSRPFLLLFLPVFLVFSSCSAEEEENRERNSYIPTVEVIETVTGALPLEERLTGVVRAENQTEIYPEVSSVVMEVMVNSGDAVTEGQPLVRLRDREVRELLQQAEAGLEIADARVRQAEAELNRLQARLTRMETLASRNLESELEIEQIRAEVESASASVALAEAQRSQAASVVDERENQLDLTIVRSPIDGFIGRRSVERGQSVNNSTRLMEVGDTRRMQITLSLTERMLSYIQTGQTVNIMSDSFGGEVVQTRLSRISPFLDPVTNTTQAEIELDNPDGLLRPGMFVNMDILYGESEQAVLIPNNALFTNPNDGRRGVYVASRDGLPEEAPADGQRGIVGPTPVSFVAVDIIARGRQVSGVEGIESGDLVVTIGQNLLSGGREEARVREIGWERMLELQELQTRDLLDMIRAKVANRNDSNQTDT